MNRNLMTALAAVAVVACAAPPVRAAAPEQARAAAPAQTDGRYGQYPQYGYPTNQSIIAEAVIEHPEPRSVRATLGAVGEPFRALSVRFDDNGYDIVRSRARDDDNDDDDERDRDRGNHRGWERGKGNKHGNNGGYNGNYNNEIGSVQVDLSRYTQWMDGQREWFLRLEDSSNRGGYLRSFVIRTDAGHFQVQNVPAYFGRDRRLEARVLPRTGYYQGYPNGNGYPYPNGGGYPYPNGGGYPYPYPNDGNVPGGVGVYRQVPQQAWAGQRVTLTYVVNLPYGQASRVEITENLPPSGWQIVRADPQPRQVDRNRHQVTWDLYQPRQGQRLVLELIVPQINGWQVFRGSYRLNGAQTNTVAGYDRIFIGEGYQPQNYPQNYPQDYPRSRDRTIGDILTDIFGG